MGKRDKKIMDIDPSNIFHVENNELVSLEIRSIAVAKHLFLDQPHLRNKLITAIDFHKKASVAVDINGKALINADAVKDGFLVLHIEGRERVTLPLSSLIRADNNGRVFPLGLFDVDWSKSYAFFGSVGDLVINEVLLFSIFYEEE